MPALKRLYQQKTQDRFLTEWWKDGKAVLEPIKLENPVCYKINL